MTAPTMASKFVYVTYIRTTQEKLWRALREPEFTRQYFFGATQECDWKVGSPWKMIRSTGEVTDSGRVVEFDPYNRYVLEWGNEFMPELKAEGYGRMTCTLEPFGDVVKLTILHEMPVPDSKTVAAVSGGWPKILASLKSLLETGTAMPDLKAATAAKPG